MHGKCQIVVNAAITKLRQPEKSRRAKPRLRKLEVLPKLLLDYSESYLCSLQSYYRHDIVVLGNFIRHHKDHYELWNSIYIMIKLDLIFETKNWWNVQNFRIDTKIGHESSSKGEFTVYRRFKVSFWRLLHVHIIIVIVIMMTNQSSGVPIAAQKVTSQLFQQLPHTSTTSKCEQLDNNNYNQESWCRLKSKIFCWKLNWPP